MAVDTLLETALACVEDFYARMFRDWPEAITREWGDCALSYSGSRHLTGANHLWPRSPDAITARALEEAESFFASFGAAWSVVHTDPYTASAAALLEEGRYFLRWRSPLLALDQTPHPMPVHPTARAIRAQTEQHLRDARWAISEAFATDISVSRRVARSAHLRDPNVIHYLIYEDEQPVCCATATLRDGMASVWNVGTRRPFRRRRYAATIMRDLLDDLRAQGIAMTALMASPSGYPLYERLGYRQIAEIAYMGPPRAGWLEF